MTPEFWRGKRVLLTGHTGFKGGWLALWLTRHGADVTGLALDPVRDDDLFSLARVGEVCDSRIVDLRDREAVYRTVADCRPEIVLHLAAQPLVLPGYDDPIYTYETNVMGTAHLLEAVRQTDSARTVYVVTSDKVYLNPGTGEPLREDDPLGGYDPYSSSKSCAEIVTACWRDSFLHKQGITVLSGRAGNVIGGGDLSAYRLLPDIWKAFVADKPVILRNPEATRPWQIVLEPLDGYLTHIERAYEDSAATPAALNFGPDPNDVWPVRRIVERAIEILGDGSWQPETDETPHEAPLLALDSSRAAETIGWQPRTGIEIAVNWTFDWWKSIRDGRDGRDVCMEQLAAFEALGDNSMTRSEPREGNRPA